MVDVKDSATKKTLESKSEELSKEFNELKKKYGLEMVISLDFPEYKVLPAEVQLALAVISKHKNKFLIGFKEANVGN